MWDNVQFFCEDQDFKCQKWLFPFSLSMWKKYFFCSLWKQHHDSGCILGWIIEVHKKRILFLSLTRFYFHSIIKMKPFYWNIQATWKTKAKCLILRIIIDQCFRLEALTTDTTEFSIKDLSVGNEKLLCWMYQI